MAIYPFHSREQSPDSPVTDQIREEGIFLSLPPNTPGDNGRIDLQLPG